MFFFFFFFLPSSVSPTFARFSLLLSLVLSLVASLLLGAYCIVHPASRPAAALLSIPPSLPCLSSLSINAKRQSSSSVSASASVSVVVVPWRLGEPRSRLRSLTYLLPCLLFRFSRSFARFLFHRRRPRGDGWAKTCLVGLGRRRAEREQEGRQEGIGVGVGRMLVSVGGRSVDWMGSAAA
ncbi:hypothetical protein BKA80DRAFT_142725 [Phyllosticta citrichinensis]